MIKKKKTTTSWPQDTWNVIFAHLDKKYAEKQTSHFINRAVVMKNFYFVRLSEKHPNMTTGHLKCKIFANLAEK